MTERQLLNSAPKQVSLFDSRIHLRFDLDNLPSRVPQHFTNIDAGLEATSEPADPLRPPGNKQIIVVTDGEPTAHIEGREVVLIYPPSEDRPPHAGRGPPLRLGGDSISSRLVEDYFYLGLVNFVEEMARVSGTASPPIAGPTTPASTSSIAWHRRTTGPAGEPVRGFVG